MFMSFNFAQHVAKNQTRGRMAEGLYYHPDVKVVELLKLNVRVVPFSYVD